MKIVRLTIIFAVLISLSLAGAIHAQGRLDRTLEPEFGPPQGMSEHSWQDRARKGDPDYLTVNMATQSGSISITQQNNNSCNGYAKSAPQYVISWKRNSISEDQRLRIFFISQNDEDTVLTIQGPTGSWLCNNNSFGTVDPTIDIQRPRTGDYSIWVATPAARSAIKGVLYVTLGQYDSNDYPLALSGQFNVVGQGSGSAGAEILYVDAVSESNGLRLSVDIRLTDLQGTEQIRLAAWPISESTNTFISNTRSSKGYTDENGYVFAFIELPMKFGLAVYDYSNDNGPIELFIPNNQLPARTRYYIDLRLQLYDSKSQEWINLREYASYQLPRIYHTS